MLAGDEQDVKKQLEDEFLDIVDYINVLSITNQASAKESRKEAETYFS
jgi:NTP pyrophosphatase (non-canonical NTP hydrolase)